MEVSLVRDIDVHWEKQNFIHVASVYVLAWKFYFTFLFSRHALLFYIQTISETNFLIGFRGC